MKYETASISEIRLIKPKVFRDDRGFFEQTYHERQYRQAGIPARFVQDNWSRSSIGVLRGLHYQLEHAQDKLVSVITGSVFDVAVDVRRGSPTFGKWVGEILSDTNHHQLFIPKGFAHGFCILSETADFVYKCSDFYAPGDEYCVRWDDPDIAIEWPINWSPILAKKDMEAPFLKDTPDAALPVFSQSIV